MAETLDLGKYSLKDLMLVPELLFAGIQPGVPLTVKNAGDVLIGVEKLIAKQIGAKGACVLVNWLAGAPEGGTLTNLLGTYVPGFSGAQKGTIAYICPDGPSVDDARKSLRLKSALLADVLEGKALPHQAAQLRSAKEQGAQALEKKAKEIGKGLAEVVGGAADNVGAWLRFVKFATSPAGIATLAGVSLVLIGGSVYVVVRTLGADNVRQLANKGAKAALLGPAGAAL